MIITLRLNFLILQVWIRSKQFEASFELLQFRKFLFYFSYYMSCFIFIFVL
jgi:hypothetical protein